MRNLKRVLSLALATVMLMGMMVMGASAADKKPLTDLDKVVNKDAVNLMVDLGIIVGKPDGSYAPTETVDRATMAKLVYFIMEGSDNADIYKGASTGLTDVAGNWAEGFINYCYSLGIVAGVGSNAYNPSGKVAVVSAAKMLLVALGYDAKLSKYENDSNWSINIMKDAQKAGLMENVDQKATAELTRDNAAQMIFNALMANTVEAETERDQGELYLKKYIANGTTLGNETYGLVAVTAKVDSISDGNAVITTLVDAPDGILASQISGKVAANGDMAGQNVTIYVEASLSLDRDGNISKATFKDIYTSTIQTSTSVLLATSMKGKTIAQLTEKKIDGKTNKDYLVGLSPDNDKDESTVTYFLNGTNTDIDATDIPDKSGVVIEFYDLTGDGLADVVKAYEKSVGVLKADIKTKTDDDGNVTVLLNGVPGAGTKYVSAVGYEDLAKDDVVLSYQDAATDVYYVELADSFVGVVDAVKSTGDVRVDGKYYAASGLAPDAIKGWDEFKAEYTFYTDNAGNIVKAVANEEVSSAEYAVVLETAWVSGGGVGSSKYMEAKILFSDGTTEIVRVNKIDNKTVVAANTAAEDFDDTKQVKYIPLSWTKGVYSYTVSSDKYALTAVTEGEIAKSASITNTAKFAEGFTANNKTIFVVEKGGDEKTYETYTGYANVPKMTTGAASWVYTDGKSSTLATYVFLTTAAYSDDAPEGLVFISDTETFSKNADGKYGYTYYDAEGNKSETSLWVTEKIDTTKKSGFFKVGTLVDDVAADAIFQDATKVLKNIGDGILEVDTDVYTYDADTIMVVAELDKDGKFVSVSNTDADSYTLDAGAEGAYSSYKAIVQAQSGVATYIYVIATTKA